MGDWMVFGSENVFSAEPYLHSKVGLCSNNSPAAVASAASVTSRLGHWTCWAFKATALRVPFPGIHVHPSLSCDLLKHYVKLKNVYVLR